MARRDERYVPLLCNYPDSEKINSVSQGAEAMFCRLLAKCDDEGNYHGAPKRLLCKLFALRYDNGTITETEVARYCDELVTVTLLARYESGGVPYLHVINCKKSLRKDIKSHIVFPAYTEDTQPIADKGVTESVTDTARMRSGCVPTIKSKTKSIQSNPIQIKSTEPDKTISPTSPDLTLNLPTTPQTIYLRLYDILGNPKSTSEQTTFKNLSAHLAAKGEDAISRALELAKKVMGGTAKNKKGYFVGICVKEFGFKKTEEWSTR